MKKLGAIILTFTLIMSLFPQVTLAAQSVDFEKELTQYLKDISEERGFEVTKEDIETSLGIYEAKIEEFDTVEDLSYFLGDVIKADLSNLDTLYEIYEMDQPSLVKLLEENGEDINDYVYIDDLENTVSFYYEGEIPEIDEEIPEDLFNDLYKELGLTDEEFEKILEHIMSLEEHLSNPETLARIEALSNKMMAFEEFEAVTELTAGQIADLASVFDELLSIFKIEVKYSLVKGSTETPLSFEDLIKIEELKGANLKMELYTTDGQFLADLIVTGDMVDSEIITEAGKEVEESAKVITKAVDKSKSEHKTIKGAKLPNTASNYLGNTIIGLFIAFAGIALYRKVRIASGEN